MYRLTQTSRKEGDHVSMCRKGLHEIRSSQDFRSGGCKECHKTAAAAYQRRYRAKHRAMAQRLESLGLTMADIDSEG